MSDDPQPFDVPRLNAVGSRLLGRYSRSLRRLGDFESHVLREKLDIVDTSRPIYICGLARSGTTVLLELLVRHPDTASHQYLDYPFVFTPYAWNRYLAFARPRRTAALVERAHKDGLKVSPESPEAMEEPIWMHFFPGSHDASTSSILNPETGNPSFERFYDAHMAKIMRVRGGTRYLAKGNYHVARIGYLSALYPKARFVVPVRDPVMSVASSMKQHRLFKKGQEGNAAARLYLRQVGHFEFGLDRSPINLDPARTTRVMELWDGGDEVGGWALYWAMVHDHVADLLEANPALRERLLIVPYESFCTEPSRFAENILSFCGLSAAPEAEAFAANEIGLQNYYRHGFTPDEFARIRAETAGAASRLQHIAKVELPWAGASLGGTGWGISATG